MIRVVVVDDQPLIRAGFAALLDAAEDIEVAGQGGDGEQALALARQAEPDVIVMDIRMPVLDGLAATRAIMSEPRLRGTRIIILTTFELDEYVFEALRAGASGFLSKSMDPAELPAAIRIVADGGALLSPRATTGLIGHLLAQPSRLDGPLSSALEQLTEREREITALVASGLSNAEIAERLFLSPLTVKTHVSNAMGKTGSRDRAQLVIFAFQTGLVGTGSGGHGQQGQQRRHGQ